jgi:hypothetical protein
MISSVNAFQKKLKLWVGHLNRNSLSHFPNLKSIVESISGAVLYIIYKCIVVSYFLLVLTFVIGLWAVKFARK